MTLRRGLLVVLGLNLLLTLVLCGTLTLGLLSFLSHLEQDDGRRGVARAGEMVTDHVAQLRATTGDYARWDDTYAFVADRSAQYIASNYTYQTFRELTLNAVVILNSRGEVLFARGADLDRQRWAPVPQALLDHLRPGSTLLDLPNTDTRRAGLLALPQGSMMVAACPITTSRGTGPIRGALVMARWVDDTTIKQVAKITQAKVSLLLANDPALPHQVRASAPRRNGATAVVKPVSPRAMAGYLLLPDIYGEPSLVLKAEVPRDMHQRVRSALGVFLFGLLVIALGWAALGLLAVERMLVAPVVRLSRDVAEVGASGDLSARVAVRGRHEIALLAATINGMLDGLGRAQRELRQSEERYRAFVEQSSDGVWRIELNQPLPIETPLEQQIAHLQQHAFIAECNDTMAHMEGYRRAEDLLGRRLREVVHSNHADQDDYLRAFVRGGYRLSDRLVERTSAQGERRHYLCHLVGIVEKGALVRAWGSRRDITARRAAEQLLRLQTSAIEAASDGVVITDADGRIVFANPAFERESGYHASQLVGMRALDLFGAHSERSALAELQARLSQGDTWEGELWAERADGAAVAVELRATPVRNEQGVVEHFIAISRNVTERKRWEERLDHLAHHDALTGLPNRVLVSAQLEQRIAQARAQGGRLAVMFLDLDRFKYINDTLGHSMGDLLLQLAAERLTRALREMDAIARTGGDEFTILVSAIASPRDAAQIAQRVLDTLSRPFVIENQQLYVTASIGISLYPNDGGDGETLVKNADTAMYRAKEQGGNTYEFFTRALTAAAAERMALERRLRAALSQGQFLLHYQPRVEVATGEVLGVEALLRWNHPEHGVVYPADFIPIAEETGLVVPMTEWVLREACAQSRAWEAEGLLPFVMDVNVSARHFQQPALVEMVRRVLEETGLPPHRLGLEITESTLMRNPDAAVQTLYRLKDMGVHLHIDDFGIGYSSLSHLRRFPVDGVKIDQSFICHITTNKDDLAIASGIVVMAHSLQLRVIAEGVETPEQLALLRELGCDEAQGYLLCRPGLPSHLIRYLRARLARLAPPV